MYAVVKDNKVISMVHNEKPKGLNLEGCKLIESDVSVCGYMYIDGKFITEPENPIIALQESMVVELTWCDLMLKYIRSGDTKRSEGYDESTINTYAISCRDYIQHVDEELSVVGELPLRPLSGI